MPPESCTYSTEAWRRRRWSQPEREMVVTRTLEPGGAASGPRDLPDGYTYVGAWLAR
ncbi:hypothetical protein HYPSUDRAFT_63619 [Hypholoma sublateritium FD-334 SS-4]|uniref:Uncharacterized protein n=1 Tax=Hypholoma sublateritium (strain FD-334 SS-4) TaxID=945553 RepID=A0A0D2Q5K8_HYPSF|nr:hypothetical protein HYPSUDRAFT_63619 [Hypholoma sublateritium FD-334 SS-4]